MCHDVDHFIYGDMCGYVGIHVRVPCGGQWWDLWIRDAHPWMIWRPRSHFFWDCHGCCYGQRWTALVLLKKIIGFNGLGGVLLVGIVTVLLRRLGTLRWQRIAPASEMGTDAVSRTPGARETQHRQVAEPADPSQCDRPGGKQSRRHHAS